MFSFRVTRICGILEPIKKFSGFLDIRAVGQNNTHTAGLHRINCVVDDNPKRKLKYTWELVHNGRCWIGINTHLAKKLAAEAIHQGWIPELSGHGQLLTEKNTVKTAASIFYFPMKVNSQCHKVKGIIITYCKYRQGKHLSK